MPRREPELITLIRLRQGSLPKADGLRLREQLATDEGLRSKWRQLSERHDPSSPSTLPVDLSEETMATFVDGRLSEEDAAEVESRCWSEPALIREAAAACAARYATPDDVTVPRSVTDRLQSLVSASLLPEPSSTHVLVGSDEIDLQDGIGTASTMIAGRTHDRLRTDQTDEHCDEPATGIAQSERCPPQQRKRLLMIAASLAAAVIVGVAVLPFLGRRAGDGPEMIARPRPLPMPTEPSPLESRSDSQPMQEPRNQGGNVMPPESVADVVPQPNSSGLPSEPILPPMASELAESPQMTSDVPVAIAWTRISGLLLRYGSSTGRWQGIHAESDVGDGSGQPSLLMTLPKSWAAGETDDGTRIILDADTQAGIALQRGEHLRVLVDVERGRGRTAIEQLAAGDVLVVRHGGEEWSAQVTETGTAVGLLVEDDGLKLHVFAGGVTLNRTKVRDGFGVLLSSGLQEPQRLTGRLAAWRHRSGETFPLRRDLLEKLLASGDVLQMLDEWNDRRSQSLAKQMAMAVDPVTRVSRLAMAADEADRVAAIEWLVHASPSDGRAATIWAGLPPGTFRQNNGGGPTTLSVQPWLRFVREPQSVGVADLQQMAAGLGQQQPLFVRQTAIYCLRQMTGRPLREYSPDQPTRAGISAVTGQVRQFQSRRPTP